MSTAKKLIDTIKDDVKGFSQKMSPTYIKLVETFPLQKITSKRQHETALKIVGKLITYINEKSSKDKGLEIYLKTLSDLVGDYEKSQFLFSEVRGAEMLAYIMELQELNQSDLSKELGGQSVVSKVLKGERELNIRQIKALAMKFKVSPEIFI